MPNSAGDAELRPGHRERSVLPGAPAVVSCRSKRRAQSLDVEKVMGRIVDTMTGDPVGIDRSCVECHREGPVVGGEIGQLLAQRAGLVLDTVQSRLKVNRSGFGIELRRW